MLEAKTFYAYLYIDPRNDKPFYVGKGSGSRIHDSHKENVVVAGRIRILKEQQLEHQIEIIPASNETAAFWLERCFIAAYGRKDLGTGCLFNHSDGGESPPSWVGKKHSKKTKEKLSTLRKGIVFSEQTKSKMSAAAIRRFSRESNPGIRYRNMTWKVVADKRVWVSRGE